MGLKESGLRGSIRNVSTGIGAAISIDTLEAENVEADSATIRGEITELTNFGEDAEVFFEFGEITEGLPNTTDIQLQDTVGVFTEDLTNLSEDTTHEFQAFGSVRDVSDEGVVLTFETGVAIPDSGGTHQWDTDEGSGSTLTDTIGSLDGSINGATWTTGEGTGGVYLDYDGTDDFVDFGSASQSGLSHWSNDGAGTLLFWVYPRSGMDGDIQPIIAVDVGESSNTFDLGFQDGGLRFESNGGDLYQIRDVGSMVIDEWQVIAASADGSELSLYHATAPDYDLVEEATDSAGSTSSGDLGDNVVLGRDNNGGSPQRHWDGRIDWGFNDDVSRSQSDLQSLVDDTKGFYE